jgi:hypothetical protein
LQFDALRGGVSTVRGTQTATAPGDTPGGPMMRAHFGSPTILLAAILGCSPGSSDGDGSGKNDAAQTTLDVPLLDDDLEPLSALNEELAAKKMKLFPASITMSGDDASRDEFREWNDYADDVGVALGTNTDMLSFQTPDGYPGLCYRGDGSDVPNLVSSLVDSVFSDQLLLIGYRFHDEAEFFVGVEPEDEATFPAEWRNFPGTNDDVLLIYVSNDSGDDITVSAIPRCGAEPADTTLDVPLIDDEGKPLAALNARLEAKDMRPFPVSLVMMDDQPSRDAFTDWNAYIDEANEALGTEVVMVAFGTPDDYPGLCYRGEGQDVAGFAAGLTDGVFSDMFQVIGYRFRDEKEFLLEVEPEEEATFPATWKNFPGTNDDVLLLHVSNDGGDNVRASVVPRCADQPAATTLDVPLVDDDGSSLTVHNATLKAKMMREFPRSIIVGSDDASRAAFSDWNKYADEVNEALGTEIDMVSFGTPDEYPGLCYRGAGEEVAELAAGLTDNVFSDMFQVLGYKLRDRDVFFHEDAETGLKGLFPPEWENFPGTNDDVMLLYVSNDSGDDITASVVPRCK